MILWPKDQGVKSRYVKPLFYLFESVCMYISVFMCVRVNRYTCVCVSVCVYMCMSALAKQINFIRKGNFKYIQCWRGKASGYPSNR